MSRLPVSANTMMIEGVPVELGPAMQALPSDKMRLFVYFYCWQTKRGFGSVTEAARLAGYGVEGGARGTISAAGWHLVKRDDIQRALAEQVPKMIAAFGIEAIHNMQRIAATPGHKHEFNANKEFLDRIAPTQSVINHRVEKVQSPEDEALQLFRDMKASGASQETMEFTFGAIGVARYERMIGGSAPAKQRDEKSKPGKAKRSDVIDVTFHEVERPDEQGAVKEAQEVDPENPEDW